MNRLTVPVIASGIVSVWFVAGSWEGETIHEQSAGVARETFQRSVLGE